MLLAVAGGGVTRQRIASAGLLLRTAVLTTVPWLVREAVVMGEFVPLTTQSGLVAAGTYNTPAPTTHTPPLRGGHSRQRWCPRTPATYAAPKSTRTRGASRHPESLTRLATSSGAPQFSHVRAPAGLWL